MEWLGVSHNRLRIAISSVFLFLAGVVVAIAYRLDPSTPTGAMMINLGTEIVGITLTVTIVDWLIETKRHRDEVNNIAWEFLNEIQWTDGVRLEYVN